MYASIDVGTNTVRMLLGDVAGNSILPHTYFRRITRLGGDFDPIHGLSEVSMARTLDALNDFSTILAREEVQAVSAVATEALRRAPNAELFVKRVLEESGIHLEVISGRLEAQLSCDGVLMALDAVPEQVLIFDIGGGSTELVYCVSGDVVFAKSYPLGTVMLCEHHPGAVAQQAHIDRTLRCVVEDMERAGVPYPLPEGILPVGTAGTVTTLAALDLEMERYDWRRINNYRMDLEALHEIGERLTPLSIAEREALPGMEKGRGDLILPGLMIVESLLDFCNRQQLLVSDFGLLEGALQRASRS